MAYNENSTDPSEEQASQSQGDIPAPSPEANPIEYAEPLNTDRIFQSRPKPGEQDWPHQSRLLYRRIVADIEEAANQADFADAAEFHGILWLAVSLSAGDYARRMIEAEQDDLNYSIDSHMSGNKETFRTKVSRWINAKATPKSLRMRQRIIASAIAGLRKSAETGTAIPLRIPSDHRRVNREPDAAEIGFMRTDSQDRLFADEV